MSSFFAPYQDTENLLKILSDDTFSIGCDNTDKDLYVYVFSDEKCKRLIFPKIKNSDLLKLPIGVTHSDLREWLKIEFLEGTTTFPQLIGTIYKMNENHNFQIGEHVFLRNIVEPYEVQILKFYKGLRGRPSAEV